MSALLFEKAGMVVTLTINRAEARNPLGEQGDRVVLDRGFLDEAAARHRRVEQARPAGVGVVVELAFQVLAEPVQLPVEFLEPGKKLLPAASRGGLPPLGVLLIHLRIQHLNFPDQPAKAGQGHLPQLAAPRPLPPPVCFSRTHLGSET